MATAFRESCGISFSGSGRGTRRMDKLQGARNNEAPVLGRIPEIGASRGYKSRGTRPLSRSVKRPIDVFQLIRTMMRVARALSYNCSCDDAKRNNNENINNERNKI